MKQVGLTATASEVLVVAVAELRTMPTVLPTKELKVERQILAEVAEGLTALVPALGTHLEVLAKQEAVALEL
jgi:hypothetical protein